MASRRDHIRMSDDELRTFLDEQKIVSVATVGPRGRPHLVPLWYVPEGEMLIGWTYAKSQKAKNLERDPRATLQVETGIDYAELRGLMFECDTVLHRDPEVVEGIAMDLVDRYSGPGPEFDPVRDFFRGQVPKRVGLQFVERRRVTWDHRKLGNTY